MARFLRMTPVLFLRGLLSLVGTDRVLQPRRGRRPVEAEEARAWSLPCLSPARVLLWSWAQERAVTEQAWLPVQSQEGRV